MRLVAYRGKMIKVWDYPDLPTKKHAWCKKCKRACLDMSNGARICPICGAKVGSRIKIEANQ